MRYGANARTVGAQLFFVIVTTLFRLVAVDARALADNQTIAGPPHKFALLIGINKYESSTVSPLEGTLNDVRDMEKLLRSDKYGFTDIVVLRNEQATHKDIVNTFQQQLINKAGPNDIVVFYYSGHGSRMKDPNEVDGYSSTIVPWDSRDPGKQVSDIRNSELNGLLRQLRTENVTTILDSCYSGTAFKGLGRSKATPEDTRYGDSPPPLPDYAVSAKGIGLQGTGGFRVGNVKYVLIAASRSDQVAFEYAADNEEHGALTYFLTQELQTPSSKITYRDIMDKVSSDVQEQYPNQIPQLDGTNADKVIFGDETLRPVPYVKASPVGIDGVRLEGGSSTGVTSGSVYAIYRPASHSFSPPEQPITTITIDSPVEPFNAHATLAPGLHIEKASKAIERQHRYEAFYTRIFYDHDDSSPSIKKIHKAFDSQQYPPNVKVVTEGAYDIRIAQEKNDLTEKEEIHIMGADGSDLSPAIAVDSPTLATTMVTRIDSFAQWFGTFSLKNAGTSAQVVLTLTPERSNKGSNSGMYGVGKTASFVVGDKFSLTVKNAGKRRLFIYLMDMTENGAIKCFYPEDNDAKALPAGGNFTLSDLDLRVDDPYRDSVLDVIKLIATTKGIPIEYLQQDAPRDMGKLDPLGQMIANARRGAREIGTGSPDDWVTTQIAVTTRRPKTN